MWLALSLAAVAALSLLFLQASGARDPWGRLLVLSIVPAAYGTSITLYLGQLGLLVVLAVLGSLLLALRNGSLLEDLLAALLFAAALAKPSIAAPFFWLLLFLPRRTRPALLAAAFYGLATLLAVAVQPAPPAAILSGFLDNVRLESARGNGFGNVQDWLAAWKVAGLGLVAGGTLMGLLGLFVFLRRRADPWVLLGLTSLFAGFAALCATGAAQAADYYSGKQIEMLIGAAGAVFAVLFVVQMLPTRLLEPAFGAESPAFLRLQVASWLVAAAFLAARAWSTAAGEVTLSAAPPGRGR